jgi:hypothetical protein
VKQAGRGIAAKSPVGLSFMFGMPQLLKINNQITSFTLGQPHAPALLTAIAPVSRSGGQ